MNLFDDKAAAWDTPVHVERATAIAAAIRRAVPLGQGATVLEFGAGTGLLGRALAHHCASVTLADTSTGMLEVATSAAESVGATNIRVMRFDFTADPVPSDRFDLIVSVMAMHHILDTEAALIRMAAMLAPGGWIAIADLDAEDGTYHVDPVERALVLPGYDRGILAASAEAAGFRTVGFSTVWEIPKNGRLYSLFLLTAQLS